MTDGLPRGHNPIESAMTMPCLDARHEYAEDGYPMADVEPPRVLDALSCDYKNQFPGDSPERVRWQESGRVLGVAPGDFHISAGGNSSVAYEVARIIVPLSGMAMVTSISTYLRINSFAGAGGDTLIWTGRRTDLPTGVARCMTDPASLPFSLGDTNLSWRWRLLAQDVPDLQPEPPVLFGAGLDEANLATPQLTEWSDNRYAWGSRWGGKKQWMASGRALFRLIVVLTTNEPDSFPLLNGQPSLQVGGTLQGFSQLGGTVGGALRNATTRQS